TSSTPAAPPTTTCWCRWPGSWASTSTSSAATAAGPSRVWADRPLQYAPRNGRVRLPEVLQDLPIDKPCSWRKGHDVRTLLLVLIALFVDASTATAAITLALEQTPTGGSAGVTTLIYDGTKLRVHRSVGGRVRSFKVYDHATKTLLEVDLENKTYRELTE